MTLQVSRAQGGDGAATEHGESENGDSDDGNSDGDVAGQEKKHKRRLRAPSWPAGFDVPVFAAMSAPGQSSSSSRKTKKVKTGKGGTRAPFPSSEEARKHEKLQGKKQKKKHQQQQQQQRNKKKKKHKESVWSGRLGAPTANPRMGKELAISPTQRS